MVAKDYKNNYSTENFYITQSALTMSCLYESSLLQKGLQSNPDTLAMRCLYEYSLLRVWNPDGT